MGNIHAMLELPSEDEVADMLTSAVYQKPLPREPQRPAEVHEQQLIPRQEGTLKGEARKKSDHETGYDVLEYADGAVYDGEWENQFRHGNGVMRWTDNSKYDGQWTH